MKKTFIPLILMVLFGTYAGAVDFVPNSMDIYKTNAPVTIDGQANEAIWSSPSVTWQSCNISLGGVDPAGYAAKFKAVYDVNNLYLFFNVEDATFVPFDGTMSDTNADNIELYFGPTDVRATVAAPAWNPATDSQLRLQPGSTAPANRASGGGYSKTFIYTNQITGFQYSTVQVAGGYNVEVVVPWEIVVPDAYVGNIAEGKAINFDVNAANCISTTSGRKVIMSWSCIDYNAWKQTVYYGNMNFKGLALAAGVENTKASDIKYSVQNNQLQLVNVSDNSQVDIYDLSGRLAKSVQYKGAKINVADMSAGLYFVRINNDYSFKIVKK